MSFNCNVCGKEFNNPKSMSNHRRWHNLPEYAKFQEGNRKKMSGKNSVRYGTKHTKESLKIMSKTYLKSGKDNINWKGNNAGYKAKHLQMIKLIPKSDVCNICNKNLSLTGLEILELSNKDHQYNRNNLDDWQWVHDYCHTQYDIKYNNKKFVKESVDN